MEIIRIAGYTEDEKAEIARTHLIPVASRCRSTVSRRTKWSITDDGLMMIIQSPLHA